jgi:hypothetical protein
MPLDPAAVVVCTDPLAVPRLGRWSNGGGLRRTVV